MISSGPGFPGLLQGGAVGPQADLALVKDELCGGNHGLRVTAWLVPGCRVRGRPLNPPNQGSQGALQKATSPQERGFGMFLLESPAIFPGW